MQRRFVVTIPEQEYVINARDERDAKEIVSERGVEMHVALECDVPEIILPEPGKGIQYYLDRFFEEDYRKYCKGYIRFKGYLCFADGDRIIAVKDGKISTSGYEEWYDDRQRQVIGNLLSQDFLDKMTCIAGIDCQHLQEVIREKDRKNMRLYHTFVAFGIRHAVNPLHLLEALYAAKSTYCRMSQDMVQPILVGKPEEDIFVILFSCT